MLPVIDVLTYVSAGFLLLVLWRWFWLRAQRRKLKAEPFEDEKFERLNPDEGEQSHTGRVIKRLRARVANGQVEIAWQYNRRYIQRGFVLTGKFRLEKGSWEPLVFEPFQDSGSWSECLEYNESRSYLFTVKKTYHFFFGLFGEGGDEIVYDQISFAVRNGKALKEKKEYFRDRGELANEVGNCYKAETNLRRLARREASGQEALDGDPRVARLRDGFKKQSEMNDYIEEETERINKHPTWSPERKAREIEKLNQMAEEIALEE